CGGTRRSRRRRARPRCRWSASSSRHRSRAPRATRASWQWPPDEGGENRQRVDLRARRSLHAENQIGARAGGDRGVEPGAVLEVRGRRGAVIERGAAPVDVEIERAAEERRADVGAEGSLIEEAPRDERAAEPEPAGAEAEPRVGEDRALVVTDEGPAGGD